jgi:ABC-2 type transport system ATP-binding protein
LSRKEILILDEPMSGLDPKARALFKRKIAALHTAGRTLFFNTHLLEDVEQLCTRMAILHQGRILFIGSPQACCQQFGTTGLEEAYLRCLEQQEEKPQREIA